MFWFETTTNNSFLSRYFFCGHTVPSLDMPINIDEISTASKRLKEKSSSDGWILRMITSIGDTLYTILLVLFNMILQCASYPSTWRTSVVAAIFKNKGSSWIPKFYRPISLVVLLSKLFDFILLERFKNWFVPNNCQSAYQTGRNCAEHVFLIRAMISHCLEKKSKLFVICVDFEGAFDKVSRHKLFRKMQKRLHAVSIFLRTKKLAPLPVKLKVLEACVCSTLLHNCETFSNKLPDDLEESLEKLNANKILRESFGNEVINSYIKLKKEEVKNFFRLESFDKKSSVTQWEKINTLDC